MEYKILADLHTHSILSEHAYSTINENITAAIEKGYEYIATTDHCYIYGKKGTRWYNNQVLALFGGRRISKTEDRINHIAGIEFNVGETRDIPEKLLKLPWKIGSCHPEELENMTLNDIKNEIEYLILNKKIDAIGHPDKFINKKFDNENYKEFYEWLTDICKENDISMEVNNSSCSYKDAVCYVKYWLKLAKKK